MENLDWTTFNKRINTKVHMDVLFNSWTTQENLEKWFLKKAQFYKKDKTKRDRNSTIQKGDTYVWTWHGSDSKGEGEVLNNNGKDNLEFTFLGCVVTVEIKDENGLCVLEIIQKEIPLDEESRMNLYVGCTRVDILCSKFKIHT